MVRLRRFNAACATSERAGVEAGSARAIVGLQVLGLTADFVRGGLITMAAMLLFRPLVQQAAALWKTDAGISSAVVVAVAAAVAAGAIWKIFHSVPRARALFLAGLVAGVALVITR